MYQIRDRSVIMLAIHGVAIRIGRPMVYLSDKR